ncbi:small ribosomal subunit Rsm22 family protein [Pendulispora rubella]|uniref:Small ribosomal subunit Rsm22 family protein n=1 Tax=Pendulispora rubella TaxID=2741070 RepID=A0ABZ2LH81_9BACT
MISPLDETWRSLLDDVARERKWPTSSEVKRLASNVRALSSAYNDGAQAPAARARSADALGARLLFSFPRDVPKGAAAVRELVSAGLLRIPDDRPLRILDVGAGLGAMTWGVARALAGVGQTGAIEAFLVDEDPMAIELAARIFKRRAGEGDIRITARCTSGTVDDAAARTDATFDLVIAGQLLSELHRDRPDAERVSRHVDLVLSLLKRVREHGALVIVEPALRARTRHLHAVRDALVMPPRPGVTLFAPCLHAAACPMLTNPGDWCHEDLPVNLPPWLVDVARGAGLRWEGLTYSYLILRRDQVQLAGTLGPSQPDGMRLRVVSDLIVTKGKCEVFLCSEAGSLVRPARLDRAHSETNASFRSLVRGDLVTIRPFSERRIERETSVKRCSS